jgi:D-alanyl-lipoteichoic acid acyltransferase DltB (MBOAT superfamily)
VAGPIVRAKDFLPQIYQKLNVTQDDINRAFLLIIGGLIKKTVISDYISLNFVDRVFDLPNSYTPFENLMASYGYTIQIYCDFSGYSDMAIGVALLLGFKLPTNFRSPYKSTSITDFWRRWHISLSTWLKDFLYI